MKVFSRILVFILFFALFSTVVYSQFAEWVTSRTHQLIMGENTLRFSHITFGHDDNIHAFGHGNDSLWLVSFNESGFIRKQRLEGLPDRVRVNDLHVTNEGTVLLSLIAYGEIAYSAIYYSSDGQRFERLFAGEYGSVFSSMSQFDEHVRFYLHFSIDGSLESYIFCTVDEELTKDGMYIIEHDVIAGMISQEGGLYLGTNDGIIYYDSQLNVIHMLPERLYTQFMQYQDGFIFMDGADASIVAVISDEYHTLLKAEELPHRSGHITSLVAGDKGVLVIEHYAEVFHRGWDGVITDYTNFLQNPAWRSALELAAVLIGIIVVSVGFSYFLVNIRKMYLPLLIKWVIIAGLFTYWSVTAVFTLWVNPEYIKNRQEYVQGLLLRSVYGAVHQGVEQPRSPIPDLTDVMLYKLEETPDGPRVVYSDDNNIRSGFLASAPGPLLILLEHMDENEGIITSYAADKSIYAAYVRTDDFTMIAVADGYFVELGAHEFLDWVRFTVFAQAFAIVFVCGIGLAIITSNVRRITKGVDRFAQGDYNTEINLTSKDELGALAAALNKLAFALHTRLASDNRQRSSYLQFIPRQLVSLMGVNEIEEVDKGTTSSRDLTMMVISFRFPDFVYQREASKLFDDINGVTQRISLAVTRNGGTIYNFAHDSCDAVFPDGPIAAVSAAVEMHQGIMALNKEREEQGEGVVVLRAAIDKGTVMMGVVGDESRIVPTAMSSHLNIARMLARICGVIDSNILCTSEIAEAADEYFVRYVGKVYDGGNLMRVYEVVDGDEHMVKSVKEKTSKQFSEGLLTLYENDYTAAKRIFMDIARIHSSDGAVRYYLYLADKLESGAQGEVCITQRRI